MLLFYVRHGDPTYHPDALTPIGERQAEAAAKRLALHGIDEIYSSTSTRAYNTALPTSELTKKEIKTIDFFKEDYAWSYFAYPNAEGNKEWAENLPEIKKLFVSDSVYQLGHKWYEHPEFAKYRFKEGAEYYKDKIDDFMLSLGYEHDRENHCYNALRKNDKRIAIFAHAGFGGLFLSSILDIPYPMFVSHFAMNHTGITAIKFAEDGTNIMPKVIQYSSDSHLYKEGLPTRHCNTFYV